MMYAMEDMNPTCRASVPPPALELRNVHLHRDGTEVIDKINLRVERDQRWVILGANGMSVSFAAASVMSLLPSLTSYAQNWP